VVVFEGALESLRRFKDDVNEVRAGTECGIGVKEYNDVQPGDQIECLSASKSRAHSDATTGTVAMPREYDRSSRVAQQLQRELSDLIRRQVKDPRVHMVTITDVDVSPDLKMPRYCSRFSGPNPLSQKWQLRLTMQRGSCATFWDVI